MGYAISRAGSASASAIPSRRRPGGGDSPNSTTSRASDERVRRARSRLQPTAAASAESATAWPSQSRRSRSPLPTNARSRLVAKVAATRPRYAHPARTTGATTRCLVRLERTALQARPRSTGATRPGRSGCRVVRDRRNARARLRRAARLSGAPRATDRGRVVDESRQEAEHEYGSRQGETNGNAFTREASRPVGYARTAHAARGALDA